MAQLPLDKAIKRLQTNDERLEKFANGGVGENYTSSSGAIVPSIQKFLATKNTEINVGAESALAGAVAAKDAAELSATEAADSAASLIGSGTAALVGTVPAGNLTAVNVQGALDELDYEKVAVNQLASSDGSSLVGYMPAGVGAVATTVQKKLRESVSVSVLDFGAVGDGVANDTSAIQAAIESIKAIGGSVFFPPGSYNISSPIVLWSNIMMFSDFGAATIIKTSATTYTGSSGVAKNAVIYLDAPSGFTSRSKIEGLTIIGDRTTVTGIFLGNSNKITVDSVTIDGVLTGVRGESNFLITMSQVRVNSSAFAFDFSGTSDKTSLNFQSCYAEACGGGWAFSATKYTTLNGCAADYINTGGKPGNPYGAAAGGNYLAEGYVYLFSASDVVLNGCGCESSTASYIYAESSNVTLNSCNGYLIENYFGATSYITAFIQLRGITPSTVILNACAFSGIANQSGVTTQYVKGVYCETPLLQKFVATSWPVVTGYGAGYDYQNLGHTVPNLLSTNAQENNIDTTGTWIPTFSASVGTFGSISYSVQSGRYSRIGDMVIANFTIVVSAVTIGTAGGALQIGGLPFTVSGAEGQANYRDVFASQGPDFIQYSGVGTNMLLRYKTATSYANVPPTAIQTNSMLQGTITYYL